MISQADVHALSWEEGQRLIAACAGDRERDVRDQAIIILGLRTGMLRFSMCQLSREDLDLTSRPRATLSFIKKGGDPHTIELDPDTRSALQRWVACLKRQGLTKGRLFRSISKEGVLGDQLTSDGLYRALGARAAMAGLPDLTPYALYCTFVAWAKSAQATETQIARVTGAKLESTAKGLSANFLIPRFADRRAKRR